MDSKLEAAFKLGTRLRRGDRGSMQAREDDLERGIVRFKRNLMGFCHGEGDFTIDQIGEAFTKLVGYDEGLANAFVSSGRVASENYGLEVKSILGSWYNVCVYNPKSRV